MVPLDRVSSDRALIRLGCRAPLADQEFHLLRPVSVEHQSWGVLLGFSTCAAAVDAALGLVRTRPSLCCFIRLDDSEGQPEEDQIGVFLSPGIQDEFSTGVEWGLSADSRQRWHRLTEPGTYKTSVLVPGQTLGRYEIRRLLGAGGMGLVYEALDRETHETIALKVLSGEIAGQQSAIEQFKNELRFARKITHKNVCRVHDFVRAGEIACIAMEYVSGESLRSYLKQSQRANLTEALDIISQICDALAEAHRNQIVHRDLKPENIMMDDEGRVRIMDFGLAHAFGAAGVGVAGTPAYMAPEQILGDPPAPSVDQYAVGLILYELLTGVAPFAAADRSGLLTRHTESLPPNPKTLAPAIPAHIDMAIMRSLAKDPSARFPTVEAFSQALRHEIPVVLPRFLTNFIGRSSDIGDGRRLLKKSRLLTLIGPGGCGKTRLAVELAETAQDDYPDGLWFVDLAAVTDPALLPQALMGTLQLRDAAGKAAITVIADHLRDKTVLLLIDNCEHLVEACAQAIDDLLGRCAHLRVVATSRQALETLSELTWQIEPMGVPAADVSVDRSVEYDAVRLFCDRASLSQPQLVMTPAVIGTVVCTCRLLDGLPLAIELAAAQLRYLAPDELLASLNLRFDVLTRGNRTAARRQQTLRATIEWSYQLLDDNERHALNKLGVFGGAWPEDAAGAVCHEMARSEVSEMLESLTKQSVVTRAPGGRFRLLQTVREFALEMLVADALEPVCRERHSEFYLTQVTSASPMLGKGAPSREQLHAVDLDYDDIREALQWSVLHHGEKALSLAGTLWKYWDTRGMATEARLWLTKALHAPGGDIQNAARVRVLNALGGHSLRQSDHAEAEKYLNEALALGRKIGDNAGTSAALTNLGVLSYYRSDLHQARRLWEESLPMARAVEDNPWLFSATLGNLGSLAFEQCDYPASRAFFAESLEIRRKLGDEAGIAQNLNWIGMIDTIYEDFDTATALYAESLALSERVGAPLEIAHALHNLGDIASLQGRFEDAQALLERSLELRRKLNDAHHLGVGLHALGVACLRAGVLPSAEASLNDALKIFREREDDAWVARALINLGAVAVARQDTPAARSLYLASAQLVLRSDPDRMAELAEHIAHLASQSRDFHDACFFWSAAGRIREGIVDRPTPVQRRLYEPSIEAAHAHVPQEELQPIREEAHWASADDLVGRARTYLSESV